jgi:aquaporin Z
MLAEFLGTFWLVLGGCGSAVLAAAFPEVGIGLLACRWPSA